MHEYQTFQRMNAAVTFQIGLNDSAWAIRRKFTFVGAWETFQGIRTYRIALLQSLRYKNSLFEFPLLNLNRSVCKNSTFCEQTEYTCTCHICIDVLIPRDNNYMLSGIPRINVVLSKIFLFAHTLDLCILRLL